MFPFTVILPAAGRFTVLVKHLVSHNLKLQKRALMTCESSQTLRKRLICALVLHMGLHIYAHKAVSQWVISEAASSTGPEGHGSFTAQHQQTVVEVRTP